VIVGSSVTTCGYRQAFAWDPATQHMRNLGTLGGNESGARAINRKGEIVGWSQTADGSVHGFLWKPSANAMIDLGMLPNATGSDAFDINENGQIVGSSDDHPQDAVFHYRSGARWEFYHFDEHPQHRATLWNVANVDLANSRPTGPRHVCGVPDAPDLPTAVFTGPASATEGDVVSFDGSTSAAADGSAVSFAWTFGDGATSTDAVPTHVYADNGSYTVTLTVTDAFGSTATDTHTISVANAAPVVTSLQLPGAPVAAGTTVSIALTYTDAGSADTHSLDVDWADGTSSAAVSGGAATATHVYTTPGVYTVAVTVRDDDGGAGSRSSITETPAYVVVYDPTGGFVTGGGWVSSPAGACQLAGCGSATGKTTFGFVARYKTGATTPDGSTEIQVHTAGMRFTSTSYDWLVVAGTKAQYKGLGTINGGGSYGFMLTAIDGGSTGSDRFRVKIWNATTGEVVYDNQAGFDDGADPSTVLGGGSITIHKN
jgi:probable HAF family extracellular repeat protein